MDLVSGHHSHGQDDLGVAGPAQVLLKISAMQHDETNFQVYAPWDACIRIVLAKALLSKHWTPLVEFHEYDILGYYAPGQARAAHSWCIDRIHDRFKLAAAMQQRLLEPEKVTLVFRPAASRMYRSPNQSRYWRHVIFLAPGLRESQNRSLMLMALSWSEVAARGRVLELEGLKQAMVEEYGRAHPYLLSELAFYYMQCPSLRRQGDRREESDDDVTMQGIVESDSDTAA